MYIIFNERIRHPIVGQMTRFIIHISANLRRLHSNCAFHNVCRRIFVVAVVLCCRFIAICMCWWLCRTLWFIARYMNDLAGRLHRGQFVDDTLREWSPRRGTHLAGMILEFDAKMCHYYGESVSCALTKRVREYTVSYASWNWIEEWFMRNPVFILLSNDEKGQTYMSVIVCTTGYRYMTGFSNHGSDVRMQRRSLKDLSCQLVDLEVFRVNSVYTRNVFSWSFRENKP